MSNTEQTSIEKKKESIFQINQVQKEAILAFISGGIAGTISRTLTNPIERVKFLRQADNPNYKNKNIFMSMIEIYKTEGFLGYFKGNFVSCIRIFPQQAIEFGTFDFVRKQFFKGKELNYWNSLFIGSCAGLVSGTLVYPLDYLRTLLAMQTTTAKYKGIGQSLALMYKENGIRGLYHGYFTAISGLIPFIASKQAIYHLIKNMFYSEKERSSHLMSVIVGGAAGCIAGTINYPSEVIKRKIMASSLSGQAQYSGLVDCTVKLYKEFGIKGFYKGYLPAMFKLFPSTAITFLIDNQLKEWFGIYKKKRH